MLKQSAIVVVFFDMTMNAVKLISIFDFTQKLSASLFSQVTTR